MECIPLLGAELLGLLLTCSLQRGPQGDKVSFLLGEGARENAEISNRPTMEVTVSVAAKTERRMCFEVTPELQGLIPRALGGDGLAVEVKCHARLFMAAIVSYYEMVPGACLQLLGKASRHLE